MYTHTYCFVWILFGTCYVEGCRVPRGLRGAALRHARRSLRIDSKTKKKKSRRAAFSDTPHLS